MTKALLRWRRVNDFSCSFAILNQGSYIGPYFLGTLPKGHFISVSEINIWSIHRNPPLWHRRIGAHFLTTRLETFNLWIRYRYARFIFDLLSFLPYFTPSILYISPFCL
jgi:hypothetical protein